MELGAAAQLCWQGCQSRSTEAEYRSCLRRFCRFAQRRGVGLCSELSPELLLRWQAGERGLRPSTRRHRAYILRIFLRSLERAHWCAPGLSQGISIPRLRPAHPKPGLALCDQRALLGAGADTRSRALCWLLLATGARISEVLQCSWGDLDEEMLFLRGKTGVRAVPLSLGCRRALSEYLHTRGRPRPQAPLLLGRQGQLSRRQASTLLRGCCQRAGLQALSPHQLRHAAAARWLSSGIPVVVVAQMLGHARPSTTWDHYSSATATQLLRGLQSDPLWAGAEVSEAAAARG